MRFKNRLEKAKKMLPVTTSRKLDPKMKWLIHNSQEFREHFKSLYRLQIEAGMPIDSVDEWENDLKESAKRILQKLDKIYNETENKLYT